MVFERDAKKLHRVAAGKRNDWQNIPSNKLNAWQRMAARTSGYVTIGNATTLAGFALVCTGLFSFERGDILIGGLQIIVGRFLDYIDGIVADMTQTKSRLGATLDETLDMVALALTLIILVRSETLPVIVAIAIAIPKSCNVLAWVIGKLRRLQGSTTAQSKVATFIIWSGIGIFLLQASWDTPLSIGLTYGAWITTLFGALLTAPSSVFYLRTAFGTNRTE